MCRLLLFIEKYDLLELSFNLHGYFEKMQCFFPKIAICTLHQQQTEETILIEVGTADYRLFCNLTKDKESTKAIGNLGCSKCKVCLKNEHFPKKYQTFLIKFVSSNIISSDENCHTNWLQFKKLHVAQKLFDQMVYL